MLNIVENRDLHTGVPRWARPPAQILPHGSRPSKAVYDAVVVGTGISGALMAKALTEKGLGVLIIDKRDPVQGSTLASTAMIQHEIDVPLRDLSKKIGTEKAQRAWRRSAKAVEDLSQLIAASAYDCDFQRKATLFLAGDEMGHRAMKDEYEARLAARLQASYLTGSEVQNRFNMHRTAGIVSIASASCNPAKLTAAILNDVCNNGAELVSNCRVEDFLATNADVTLRLEDAGKVTAKSAIFCTGYEIFKPLRNEAHNIVSTWALSAKPRSAVPDWLQTILVWEAADPYLYFRMSENGELIAGGEDEEFEAAHFNPQKLVIKTDLILKKIEALTGLSFYPPSHRWAAPFGTTATGLPLIGAVPGQPNIYGVMGFGGNGITFSQIASQIISAQIDGKTDPDADLFAFKS